MSGPNHANYDKRIDFIKSTLKDKYGLEADKMEPLDYDPDSPMKYNNYIYRVDLSAPTTAESGSNLGASSDQSSMPGTVPIPAGTSVLVMRLSNSAASGLSNGPRVQNEVATMCIVREALKAASLDHLVPSVYGWARAGTGDGEDDAQGWILMEFKSGINICWDKPFHSMTTEEKRKVLPQVADVFSAFQQFPLPDSIKEFGGVAFDETGNSFVSAPMTIVPGGPFPTYEALMQAMLRMEAEASDDSEILNGWRGTDLRERIDRFIEKGVGPMLKKFDGQKRVLVYSDFTTANLLFDPDTLDLTAVLDLDFAYVSHAGDEFFRSLSTMYGSVPGPTIYSDPPAPESDPDSLLRSFLIHGFPSKEEELPAPPADPTARGAVLWDVAKMWNDELAQRNVTRPQHIAGIEEASELFWLSQNLAPMRLSHPFFIKRLSEEAREELFKKTQGGLDRFLKAKGF